MLTNTEFKVYMLTVERGWGKHKIAESLKLRPNTVRDRLRSIMDKMGCGSALELLSQYHKREMNY